MNINLISLKILVRNKLFFRVFKKQLTIIDDNDNIIIEDVLVNTLFKLRLSDSNNSKTRIIAKTLIAKNLTN